MADDLEGVEAVELHLDGHLGLFLLEEGVEVLVTLSPFFEVEVALDDPGVATVDNRLLGLGSTAHRSHLRHQMIPGL